MSRPAFVIGPPRSGTTLMLDLLRQHPAVCGHEERFHRFHHDLMLFKERQESRDHFRLTTVDASPEIAAAYRAAIAEALHESDRTQFVLKISTLSIQIDYLLALFPEARFVQMVRDARDSVCSLEDLRRALESRQGHDRDLGPAPDPFGLWCADHFEDKHLCAAATWTYHVTRSWLDLCFAGQASCLRVRYEDLLARPQETLASVLAFLELEPAKTTREALAAVRDQPGPRGGLGFSVCQARGPTRVQRYQRDLPAAARVAMAPLVHLPMLLLGYQPDPLPDAPSLVQACAELGADASLWQRRLTEETDWFALHQGAFAPEHLLKQADHPSLSSRPLLVNGALVGCREVVEDGGRHAGLGWVAKQARRHTFPDPDARWPALAAVLQGRQTIAELGQSVPLGDDILRLFERLHGLGFLSYA